MVEGLFERSCRACSRRGFVGIGPKLPDYVYDDAPRHIFTGREALVARTATVACGEVILDVAMRQALGS
jgi:hypothetical protein